MIKFTKSMFMMWLVAGIVWFITTVTSFVYLGRSVTSSMNLIHADHLLLIQMATAQDRDNLNRDIELRKRLITLQDRLTQLESKQIENTDIINELGKAVREKKVAPAP